MSIRPWPRRTIGWEKSFYAVVLSAALTSIAAADLHIGPQASLHFASLTEAKEILGRRDEYTERLSEFDRTIRMRSSAHISAEAFVKFMVTNARNWNEEERARVETAYAAVAPRLESLALPWPTKIYLVKTAGNEEGGAAYTRGSAIMLPVSELEQSQARLTHVLGHELLHKLYATIGFRACPNIKPPPKLQAVRITNPDAPIDEQCIRVESAGARIWAMPIMYSSKPNDYGRTFFDHLQVRLLLLGGNDDEHPPATVDERRMRLVRIDNVSGFYEQVGRNTEYVAHPEEILADNFALLVRDTTAVASPEILGRIEAELRKMRRRLTR
jgi:hypothetical protein